MRKANRKKLLKEPDEFLTLTQRAIQWAQNNTRLIIVVVCAAVVVVGAWVGISSYLEHRRVQAAEALAAAFADYALSVDGRAKPQQEKEAVSRLQKVAEQYGATPAGIQARLALGSLLVQQGSYARAREVLSALSEEPDLPPEIAALVWQALGQALEGEKKYSQAAEAYGQAVRLAGPNLALMFRLDQARALAAAGDKDQAARLYRGILEKYPSRPEARTARERLAALGLEARG
jgi:predicted negative regulator of RcsB-dependent stress response